MAKFRKKPIEIEAVQWTGDNIAEVTTFLDGGGMFLMGDVIEVKTIHGESALIRKGDWIMPEPNVGRFYPCNPEIFAATYDPI